MIFCSELLSYFPLFNRDFFVELPCSSPFPTETALNHMLETNVTMIELPFSVTPTTRLLQCEAPKIAKLVQQTPITMVYGTYNYSFWGESKPTYNWGAPHCTYPIPIAIDCWS